MSWNTIECCHILPYKLRFEIMINNNESDTERFLIILYLYEIMSWDTTECCLILPYKLRFEIMIKNNECDKK